MIPNYTVFFFFFKSRKLRVRRAFNQKKRYPISSGPLSMGDINAICGTSPFQPLVVGNTHVWAWQTGHTERRCLVRIARATICCSAVLKAVLLGNKSAISNGVKLLGICHSLMSQSPRWKKTKNITKHARGLAVMASNVFNPSKGITDKILASLGIFLIMTLTIN